MEELDLDALLIPETRVSHDGKTYFLRAPTEAAATRFQSARMKGARLVGDRLEATVENVITSQKLLVSLCLFDESGKAVPLSVVESWQTQMVAALFKKAHGALEQQQETEESIEKKIAELQSRLDAMRGAGGPEGQLKNS